LTRGVVPAATAGEVFYKLHAAAGIDPAQFEDGLRALGIDLVDLSVAAARHFPALKAVDALRREQLRAAGVRPVQTPRWETSAAWATPPQRGCRCSPATGTGPLCNHWGYR